MDIEVISEKENKMFSRREISARVSGFEVTPSRKALVSAFASKFGADEKAISILKVGQEAGRSEAVCLLNIYQSADGIKNEEKYLRERTWGKEEKKEGEAGAEAPVKEEAKAEPKKKEKKAEKKES
ncbi:MAG: hypothetical protein V1911_03980 [Candidatus Micrarchaeota archaeon]